MQKERSNHAVFSLCYHLVIVTKRRQPVFDEESTRKAGEILSRVGESHGIIIEEINGEADHIHVLLRARPTTNLVKFIDSAKSASSRILKQEFPAIQKKLATPALWSRSYCLLTTGGASTEIVRRYIKQQGKED